MAHLGDLLAPAVDIQRRRVPQALLTCVLTLPSDRCCIGARWDDESQIARFAAAQERGLLAYQEVNYPISAAEDPTTTALPILAHTSNNPVASIHGIDGRVAAKVKAGADASNSPWIGEHLSWLGYAESGALGYVLNPLLTDDFCDVSVANAIALREYYGRQIALELGPFYSDCNREGALLMESGFGTYVAPKPNRLVVLRAGVMHSVRRVECSAGDHLRAAISGFFVRDVEALTSYKRD